jgi:hypothetical protein
MNEVADIVVGDVLPLRDLRQGCRVSGREVFEPLISPCLNTMRKAARHRVILKSTFTRLDTIDQVIESCLDEGLAGGSPSWAVAQ